MHQQRRQTGSTPRVIAAKAAIEELRAILDLCEQGEQFVKGDRTWTRRPNGIWQCRDSKETSRNLASYLWADGITVDGLHRLLESSPVVPATPPPAPAEKPLAIYKRVEQGQPKRCNKCGGTEPETYFYPSQKSLCKECQTKQARLTDRAKSEKYIAPEKRRPRYEIDAEGRKLDEKPPMLAEYDHPAEPEPVIAKVEATDPSPNITPMAEIEIPTDRLTVYESCLKIFSETPLSAGIDDALEAIMDMQRKEWDTRPPVPTLKAPLQLLDESPVGQNKAQFARAAYAYLHERLTRTPCCDGDAGFGFLHGVAQAELEYDPDGWFYCSIGVRSGKCEISQAFMSELTRDMAELFPVYVWCEQIGEICNTLPEPETQHGK